MDQTKRFTEVFIAYNECVAKLELARKTFQEELKDLNSLVSEHLAEVFSDGERNSIRHRWGGPEDWSTTKDGPWLNFISSTKVWLDIKQENNIRFSRKVSYLYFESRFDKEMGSFIFQCRLENQNVVNDYIDEEVIKIISSKGGENFPNHGCVKANRAILFKKELSDEIFSLLNQDIDAALDICEEAIEVLFPINKYREKDESDESPELI
jgi:hypothetical protein